MVFLMLRCPMCKSRDIHRPMEYEGPEYYCKKCGYHGVFVVDIQSTGDHGEKSEKTG
jgi:transposase-like protein